MSHQLRERMYSPDSSPNRNGNHNNHHMIRKNGGLIDSSSMETLLSIEDEPKSNINKIKSNPSLLIWFWSRCKNLGKDGKQRWSHLSMTTRTYLGILLLLVMFNVLVGLYDALFQTVGPLPGSTNIALTTTSPSTFVVVINTYKRPQQLADAVRHYAGTCGPSSGVERVYIVWAELDVTPPDTATAFFPSTSMRLAGNRPSPVQILRVSKDSLNSRFLPLPRPSPQEEEEEGSTASDNNPNKNRRRSAAIFMVDDDIRVDCHSLEQAFAAWRQYPTSMVGFYPRLALPARQHRHRPTLDGAISNANDGINTQYVYHCWPMVFWKQQMNLVLTKAAFLHERYLNMYSDPTIHPKAVLDLVDRYFNCEDIAMSMLVANVTRTEAAAASAAMSSARGTISHQPPMPAIPIYVHGHVSDQGLLNGISSGSGHMIHRSECLSQLIRIYQQHGWSSPPPLQETFDLSKTAWKHPAPGWWWQYRPSHVLEWVALQNFFE